MRNLLNFLVKYNSLIVFLILESIAIIMLTSGDNYHNLRLVTGMQGLTRGISERIDNSRTYFSLREINAELAEENSILRGNLERLKITNAPSFSDVEDTINRQQYRYMPGKVIQNSVNKQKNFFTINRGTRHGIQPDMAVRCSEGVAGVVVGCSENFSVAISVLNIDFRLSARLRSSGYFGSLNWDGRNYREALLNEIPQHIGVSIGDTVETSGYSTLFPEGIPIGTVSDLVKSGSDFYRISVTLFTDFRKLSYVEVIGNLKKDEQLELESRFQ